MLRGFPDASSVDELVRTRSRFCKISCLGYEGLPSGRRLELDAVALRSHRYVRKNIEIYGASESSNCVTYPPTPWVHTVICGDRPTHIVVGCR
jgi:hypothetical protein